METRTVPASRVQAFYKHLVCEEKSTATLEKYLRDVRAFGVFMGDGPVTKESVVAYKKQLQQRGYALRSINSMLASVNSFLGFLGWQDCRVKFLKQQKQVFCPEEKELSKGEYLRLLEAAGKDRQLYLVMQTICSTGIRVSELRHFTLEQVRQGEITVDCKGKRRTILLPGKLQMKRSAHDLYRTALSANVAERQRLQMMSYAYAASEENADGKTVVTAPTLGACGVIASMVYHYYNDLHYDDTMLADALAVGGLFGNLVKTNATISGAVGGCQAEVGTAVSMASAAIAFLDGQTIDQIEYAAEIGMEHNLGLTCDPVMGYVMIPCIERNAVGILRAMDCALLSRTMSMIKPHRISFDMVVSDNAVTGTFADMGVTEDDIVVLYMNDIHGGISADKEYSGSSNSLGFAGLAAVKEEAQHGIGFSTAEELQMWLEGAES